MCYKKNKYTKVKGVNVSRDEIIKKLTEAIVKIKDEKILSIEALSVVSIDNFISGHEESMSSGKNIKNIIGYMKSCIWSVMENFSLIKTLNGYV